MLGNGGIYAVKKRKRPMQKSCGLKTEPHDGTKSNPSKRHRDRLNGELDKLTALLPFPDEVRARLDKLSVLRLSVAYLKIKNFFTAALQKNVSTQLPLYGGTKETATSLDGVSFSEGDLLLQALNGFVVVVSTDGYIFYASPTIQEYLGFHQSDVVHQSVFDLIHIDDRAMFRCQLHFALDPKISSDGQGGSRSLSAPESYTPQSIPPENSSFLDRSFSCRMRCLLDNSSGFLALNFQGRLKYLHRPDQTADGNTSGFSQLALFAIATPVQPPAILEIRAKTLFFQTKHKLDFTPMGVDTRGKVVLGYSEQELCKRGSGYQFIHAADMMYCADKHLQMMKTGESGFTIFRLLTKNGGWIWVQSNARMVFKGGKPDFIICRQKPLTNEEGEEHLRKRQLQIPFSFATGEALLYETFPSLMIPGQQNHPFKEPMKSESIHPDSILGSLLSQDHSIYKQTPEAAPQFSLEQLFVDSYALLSVPSNPWQQGALVDSIQQDFIPQAVPDSLVNMLGKKEENGVLKDLKLEQGELKEVEQALLQLQEERGDIPIQLNEILANDVFSYVEDALVRETGCCSQSKPAGTEMYNGHNSIASQRDNTGPLQNHVLPGNQPMRCQNSFSDSQKLPGSDLRNNFYGFSGQGTPERMGRNDSHNRLISHPGIQTSFSQTLNHSSLCSPVNTTVSFPIPSHNNPPPSVHKTRFTDSVLSDPSQNSQHYLPPNVPGRRFSVNSQHPDHQGALQPWQQEQHAVPLTLQNGLQRSDCISHHPFKTQRLQDSHSHTELYAMNHAQISQSSAGLSSGCLSESSGAGQVNNTGHLAWPVSGYQTWSISNNEPVSGLQFPGSMDTDRNVPPCQRTSGQNNY